MLCRVLVAVLIIFISGCTSNPVLVHSQKVTVPPGVANKIPISVIIYASPQVTSLHHNIKGGGGEFSVVLGAALRQAIGDTSQQFFSTAQWSDRDEQRPVLFFDDPHIKMQAAVRLEFPQSMLHVNTDISLKIRFVTKSGQDIVSAVVSGRDSGWEEGPLFATGLDWGVPIIERSARRAIQQMMQELASVIISNRNTISTQSTE